MISSSLGSSRKFHALLGKAGKLGEFAQALFPLIVTQTDDFGRLEGDAFTIKHKVFPTSPRPEEDFIKALEAMRDVGLIHLYQVNGVSYLSICNFDDHQSGLHKRTKSKFPEPPGSSRKVPEIPASRARAEEKRREHEEKRTEGNGREGSARARAEVPVGLNEHPAVVAYWERFRPEKLPALSVQDRIVFTVGEDLRGWSEALDFWETNNYRPESVGKILERYLEKHRVSVPQQHSGRDSPAYGYTMKEWQEKWDKEHGQTNADRTVH